MLLTIVGDGSRRDFTYIDDIVDGLWRIYIKNNTYRCLGAVTSSQYINELASYFNHPIEYIPEQKGNYRSSQRVNSDAIDMLWMEPVDRLKEYVLQVN